MSMEQESRLVLVHWLDSISMTSSWVELEDVEHNLTQEAMLHQTAGWVVAESEQAIAIAASRTAAEEERRLGEVIIIPKASITSGPHLLKRTR